MEKTVRYLSAIITSVLVYGFFAYVYLSFKGFVRQDGTFVLMNPAVAEEVKASSDVQTNGIATKLDDNLAINFEKANLIGNANALLTIYELSSLGCMHCADFHLSVLPKIAKDFIEQNKLNVVFVNFPLEKKSMQAAMIFECVPSKNRENYLKTVFENQREWTLGSDTEKALTKYAIANGLSKAAVEECLKNDTIAQRILTNRQEGIDKLKMQGTPAFLISGNNINEIIYGVPNYDDLKEYLEKRLEK